MGDSTYWEWHDEQLLHPDGRATGGEPCVQCGLPIPPGAYWKQRDRHVCSPQCNANLRRRLRRSVTRGTLTTPTPTPLVHDPGGVVFGTDPAAEFPYEFLGWAPLVGDVVERHGSVTLYLPREPYLLGDEEHEAAVCLHHNTRAHAIVGATTDGLVGGIWFLCLDPAGDQIPVRTFFTHEGKRWIWTWETFRDLDEDGRSYSWSAPICVAEEIPTLWTSAFSQRSKALNRASASTARHARRQRMAGTDGGVDRIDPIAIYERDSWTCQLCHCPVDRALRHPDPQSPSLDHRLPLAAGGRHVEDNVWTAHLRCNIRKGARVS
ncbi:MAG: HNH endonuclease signature motif containing protein [Acidimicrobiia bacterium]